LDSETLHQEYVPRWNVINESALDDPDVFRNLVDQLAPPLLFSQLRRWLVGQVAALESVAVSKDAELASSNAQVAKVTQDLSNLQLSCDEVSVKASSLEFEKD
ncbi:hypothetical protein Tco_1222453, partial [Tanacetum coccineum]